MIKAALRAPDHGKMKPYHFVVIEKSGMPKLRECLAAAAVEFNMDEKNAAKAEKTFRPSADGDRHCGKN
ncbi:nitroreductase [Actinobacillus lignieresii]|nr:nitroreductase [Actinobacillus lignieresii]